MHTRSASRVAAAFADEEAVVEDVVVRERRAFGKSRRARGVLDVDRFIELTARLAFRQRRVVARTGARDVVVPARLAGLRCGVAGDHDLAQRGKRAAHLAHHREVLAGLVAVERDQRAHAALAQRVLQLRQPVRGVDVHQDRADLRRGVLREHPLQRVGRPDPDALAVLHAGGDERFREPVGLGGELRVRQPPVLVHRHDGVVAGKRRAIRSRLSPMVSPRSGTGLAP